MKDIFDYSTVPPLGTDRLSSKTDHLSRAYVKTGGGTPSPAMAYSSGAIQSWSRFILAMAGISSWSRRINRRINSG